MKQEGVDNFEQNLISEFSGYNSSRDKTNIKESFFVRGSKNVYKKLSGTIANRPGLKRRGTADTALAGVDSSWEWNTWDGRTLPLRICNSKLQFESDISGSFVWYDLLDSLTTTAWIFDKWWDSTNHKDVLLFVGGSTTLYHWSGAVAKFVSYLGGVITLDRDVTVAGFSATGSITINGNTYTYTGRSGSTLTGTSDASAAVADEVAYEIIGSNSNTPASTFTNDFIKVINNHLYVGSYSSHTIYVSKTSDYTSYAFSTPPVQGDGDVFILDNTAKGITVRQGQAWIGSGTSDWHKHWFTVETLSTTLTQVPHLEKQPTSVLSAPLRHEFIDNIGDEIICLTQDQQVRIIGQFRNQFTTKYPSLSLGIKTELEEEDFTGGHLRCIGDFIYVTAPQAGKTYLHETRETIDLNGNITAERIWHAPQINGVSRYAVIDGVVYGHSTSNPQIYQIWDTLQYHDDSPTDEPISYDSVLRMAYRSHGRRQGIVSFNMAYYEGYASQGTNLYSYILSDYQGSLGLQNPTILDESTTTPKKGKKYLSIGATAPSIGDSPIGDNPLGDGLTPESQDQESLPKFRVITDLQPTNCFEYQQVVYSQDVDSRWEILALGTNATIVLEQQATMIRR